MTHQNDYTFTEELAEKGLEAVPELLRVLINNAMQVERTKYLQAEEYERTEERIGHANGYKPKTVHTRVGDITLPCPRYGKEDSILRLSRKACGVKGH